MKQLTWFDRKFNFDIDPNILPSIIERLIGTPLRLTFKAKYIPIEIQSHRINDSWSIKENIGHLSDLEHLWQGRLEDILEEKKILRPWDFENNRTTRAGHNEHQIEVLIDDFEHLRGRTINLLNNVQSSGLGVNLDVAIW